MNPGVTDVASYLAARIPTGSRSLEETISDWRLTLYNARRTAALRPLTELVRRSLPEDREAVELCQALEPSQG